MMKDECGMINWENESSSLDFHKLRKDFSPPMTPSLAMSEYGMEVECLNQNL